MHVLITSPTFPPLNSGLGNAVQRQAAGLTARGVDVTVATGGDARSRCIDPGSGAFIERFRVRGDESLLHGLSGDVRSYADFLTASAFDAVVMNGWQIWSTDIPLRMLDSIKGRKYVYSHGLATELVIEFQRLRSALRWLAWRPYRWRLPARMRRLDGMIFLAEDGCDCRFADARLARTLGVRSWVIPNAAPAANRSTTATAPRAERHYLAAVGAYDRLKGHDFVLRAYARSAARNEIPLRFFGQAFTPFTQRLRDIARELGVAGSVRFHEGVSGDALFAAYEHAILLLLGSHTECQPLVLLDAMATATPFVARASGCIPGLPGGVAVANESEAAREIDRLVTDETAWQELSAFGLDAARTQFHPRFVGNALAGLLGVDRAEEAAGDKQDTAGS